MNIKRTFTLVAPIFVAATTSLTLGLTQATLTASAQTRSTTKSTTSQTTPSTTTPSFVTATPGLWMVKDSDTTIYLFGSVHVLPKNIDWFRGEIKRAYESSSEVVLEELNPDQPTQQSLIDKIATDPDGPALTKKMTARDATTYRKLLAKEGIPAEAFEKYEPWFVAMSLGVLPLLKAGLSPDDGVEQVLTVASKRDGKKIGELESFEMQLNFFDRMSETDQLKSLESTVASFDKTYETFQASVVAWSKGDLNGIVRATASELESQPSFEKILLTDRNTRWAKWIDTRLDKPGTVFVAVGALHLAGKHSVQVQLKKRSIIAKRVS
jgi:uncharacterized protein